MNAERLHLIALTLKRELDGANVIGNLQNLVNVCQQISQNPSNSGVQQNFVGARDGFYGILATSPSDSFSPAWRQALSEIGGESLVGKKLKERVEKILNENQPTLFVAYQQLNEILSKLQAFYDSINKLVEAFSRLAIGTESLSPGEAEIAYLVPRRAIHDNLSEFTNELRELKSIVDTFTEVVTGHVEEIKVRSISSTDLSVFLAATPKVGAALAAAIMFVVGTYKTILEIRKLSREIERIGMPKEIADEAREYANSIMDKKIEEQSIEIAAQYTHSDDGRKNELTLHIKQSLRKMANRIDKGFNFEVRIEPPKTSGKAAVEDDGTTQAVRTILDATVHMQFINLEGQPILSLPEGLNGNERTEAAGDPPRKKVKEKK